MENDYKYITPKKQRICYNKEVLSEKMEIEEENGQKLIVIPSNDKNNTFPSPDSDAIFSVINPINIVYQRTGDLHQLNENYQFIKMEENITFCIRKMSSKESQMEIYNYKNSLVYINPVHSETSYFFDFEEEIFKWVDLKNDVIRVLAFKINENALEFLVELKRALVKFYTQDSALNNGNSSIKKTDEEILLNSVTKNLAIKLDQESKSDSKMSNSNIKFEFGSWKMELDDDFDDYKKQLKLETDSNQNSNQSEDNDEFSMKIRKIFIIDKDSKKLYDNNFLAQSKILNRVFITRGPIINVYRTETDNQEGLEVINLIS